jgi:hypothetical protein
MSALFLASCATTPTNEWRITGIRAPSKGVAIVKPVAISTVLDSSDSGNRHVLFPYPRSTETDFLSNDAVLAWSQMIEITTASGHFKDTITDRPAMRDFLTKLGVKEGAEILKAIESISIEGRIEAAERVTDLAKFEAAMNSTASSDIAFDSLRRSVQTETGHLISGNAQVSEGRYSVVVRKSVAKDTRIFFRLRNSGGDQLLAASIASNPKAVFTALSDVSPNLRARAMSAGPTLELSLLNPIAGEIQAGWLLARKDGTLFITPLASHRVKDVVNWSK